MFKPTASVFPRFSLFFAVISLAACGGSSDGGSNPVQDVIGTPEAVATGIKPGVYSTTISGDSNPQALTLISSTGEYAVFADALAGTFGTLTFTGDETISGSATNVFFDRNWQSVDGSLQVSTINSEAFTAAFTAANAGPGVGSDITGTRINEVSDRRLTMQELFETYSLSETNRDTGVVTQRASVTIDPDGTVFGSEITTGTDPGQGCIISGDVGIPDPAYNIIEGDLSFTNCADIEGASRDQRNGNYHIIGYLLRFDDGEKRLVFAGTNGDVMSLFSGSN
jgi:hypothetical protein